MSFSSSVKNELAKIRVNEVCDVLSELSGLVPMCGSLKFTASGIKVYFNTENASVARRIFTFLKKFYSNEVEVQVSKSRQLNLHNMYSVNLKDSSASKVLLYDLDFIRGENVFTPNYRPSSLLRLDCCKKAYIRGAFLGAGSVSNPEKHYHLEFVCNTLEHSRFLSELINYFGFNSKVISRKEYYIVYIKEAEQISDIISLMGASNSTLDFESVRVFKSINNQVNRLVNLENANLNKIVNTHVRQVMDIKLIQEKIGLDSLPENLREVAMLRLEDDSISLKELGSRLKPPIGKSGVNHRLNKIKDIASKLRSEGNANKNN
ncbi:MAG: DNA-binding protein WhiA [Peptoniphilaceae bacterium]